MALDPTADRIGHLFIIRLSVTVKMTDYIEGNESTHLICLLSLTFTVKKKRILTYFLALAVAFSNLVLLKKLLVVIVRTRILPYNAEKGTGFQASSLSAAVLLCRSSKK